MAKKSGLPRYIVDVEWIRSSTHSAILIDGKFVPARALKLEHRSPDEAPTVSVTFVLHDLKVRDVSAEEFSELIKNAQDDNG